MDIKTLDRMARNNEMLGAGVTLFERWYYVAIRGLYAQHALRQITTEQAEHDKEVVVEIFSRYTDESKMPVVELNKKQVTDAITLELGRYISCAMTNENREKAYPRELFDKRILMVIDDAYAVNKDKMRS